MVLALASAMLHKEKQMPCGQLKKASKTPKTTIKPKCISTTLAPTDPTTQAPPAPTTQAPTDPTTQAPPAPTTQAPPAPTTTEFVEPTTAEFVEPTTQDPPTQAPPTRSTQAQLVLPPHLLQLILNNNRNTV